MLVKNTNSDKREWSSLIDTCVFAYNTYRHDTNYSADPKGALVPDFTESSLILDEDNIFNMYSVRDYWLRGFQN